MLNLSDNNKKSCLTCKWRCLSQTPVFSVERLASETLALASHLGTVVGILKEDGFILSSHEEKIQVFMKIIFNWVVSLDQPSKSTGRRDLFFFCLSPYLPCFDLPSVPDNLLLKRAIQRRYVSTYRSWVDSKGTMHFTPPFFGQHFTRFAQLLVTNAQHGWVSWQISLLVDESPLLNHFCEVFFHQIECRCVVSEKSFIGSCNILMNLQLEIE